MRLKDLREERGISQQEFGKIFNAAQNTISNWERENASILSTHCGLTISIDTECDDHPMLKRLEGDFEKATHV